MPAREGGRRQRLLPNLLLGLVVTMALVGALEGGSRLLERLYPAPKVAAYLWDWEERWEGDFYTVGPAGSGWPPWEEFNADGVRDRTHPVEKLEGAWRVAFLGDSVTMGAGLEPRDAYPQVLETLLKRQGRGIEVFNFALWGWSTRQERIAYERLARKYRPDLVVLAVCLNDVPELQNNLSRPHAGLAWLHRRSALVRRVVDAEGRQIRSLEELFEPQATRGVAIGYARLFADLGVLHKEAASDGVGLAVLVLPVRSQLAPAAPPPRPQEKIAEFCRSQGIPFLDLMPALRRAAEPAFIDIDHLTAAGMRVVAEQVLASEILSERLRAQPAPALETSSVAALVQALEDASPSVRAAAASALEKAGERAQPAGSALVARLRDPDENVRLRAADALLSLRPDPGWLPELRRILEEEADAASVRSAARVVAAMGPAAGEAVASLVAALEGPSQDSQAAVAHALGQIGPDARAAVPRLIEVLARSGETRVRAVEALGLIRDPRAVGPLCGALGDPSGDVRWQVARALGRIGPAAAGCVPPLLRALGDPNADVRMAAVRALPRIGVERGQLEPALEKLRSDPNGDVRAEAARALRGLRR